MARLAGRSRWLILSMAAVLALPIVAITAYLTYEIQQNVDGARTERGGVATIAKLEAFFTSASQFALARSCPGAASDLAAARAAADADLAAAESAGAAGFAPRDWTAVRSAWAALRAPGTRTKFDALFGPLDAALMQVGDRSGLTFDPNFAGISLADALAYRLPEARNQLQAAQRRLCRIAGAPALPQRLELKKRQVLADKSVADALQDNRDAIAMAGAGLRLAHLSSAYDRARKAAPRASSQLDAFMTAAAPTNRTAAIRSLDEAMAALRDLMRGEIPALDGMLEQRIAGLERQRLIRLIPGVAGVFAAVLVAVLMIRLAFERGALEVAQKAAADQERMALHDGLTGIMNRRAFFSALERAVTGGTNHGALCVFDVDRFKEVNDTYGHMTGDEILIRLAATIEASVRSTDAVARLGGDEFAVFLHPPIDRRGVERFLEQVTADMAKPIEIRGEIIVGSVSVGASLIRGETMAEVQDALGRADAALYRAKAASRGSWAIGEE